MAAQNDKKYLRPFPCNLLYLSNVHQAYAKLFEWPCNNY